MAAPNIEAGLTMLGLVALFLIWYGPYRSFFLSAYRQLLFETRNDFFLYAAEGNIEFRDRAYKEVENLINGHIAIAHRLTFFNLIILKQWSKNMRPLADRYRSEFEETINGIKNDEVRQHLRQIIIRINGLTGLYLIVTSPGIWIPCFIVGLVYLFTAGYKVSKSKMESWYDRHFGDVINDIRTAELIAESMH